jgi:hypothetical protein
VLLTSTPPNLMQTIPGPRIPAGRHAPPMVRNETPAPLPDPNELPRGVTPRRPDPGGGAVLNPGGMALRQSLRGGGGCLSATPGRGQFRGKAGPPSVGPGLGRFLGGGGRVSLFLGGGALPSLGASRAARLSVIPGPFLSGGSCLSVGPGRGRFLSGGGRVSLFLGGGALRSLGLSGAA